ncbi:MAG: hypothetical protein WB615_08085, partial [Candidatus Tumulicola sp.]
MPTTRIANPEPGESLAGIDPQLLQQLDAGWRHRLNLFTGRALGTDALDKEQLYRSGLLATLGQAVTPGIVNGLVLSLDASTPDPLLTVTPGYGIAASGEDVALARTLQTRLSTLAVIDSATGLAIADPDTLLKADFRSYAADAGGLPAGVFVLQPIVAQVNGQTFDDGSGPLEVSGNLNASCDQDPEEYAFEDWQTADGLQLVFVPWPAADATLPLPAANPQATFRNRLVYTVFAAETQLESDAVLPWMTVGVPVALVAFDAPGRIVWEANTAFSAGQMVTDAKGNVQQVQTPGISGAAAPAWNATVGAATTDGGVTWINTGPRTWQAKAAYVAGQTVVDSNGYLQNATSAGTSGAAQPAVWNETPGGTTQDGTVAWTNAGFTWQPLFV